MSAHSDPAAPCWERHNALRRKLQDGTVEIIEGADAYQPDGQFTTFFALEEGRSAVDCWSVRMASIRSAEIVAVWRRAEVNEDQRLRRPPAAA